MKIQYNAPLILNFALICAVLTSLNEVFGQSLSSLISLPGSFHFGNPIHYLNLFTYTFGHAGFGHLLGNMTFILLLGPSLEEKYGRQNLLYMMIITAFVTAVLNISLFDSGLWGASGIVFLFIILNSFTSFKAGHIPLTFILVTLLFLGQEVVNAIKADQISQFAHILGGICGGFFGFKLNQRRAKVDERIL